MKNAPDRKTAIESAQNKRHFTGTDNPRHLRVIAAMLHRPLSRENLDSIAGCSNGPALVSDLHDLGLEIPCTRIKLIDRDGRICRPGVYSFTEKDRRLVHQWIARRKAKAGMVEG